MNINLLLIIAVIIAAVVTIYIFVRKTLQSDDGYGSSERAASVDALKSEVKEAVHATVQQQLKDLDLSEDQLKRREQLKRELRNAQLAASHGDAKAKLFMLKQIIRIITDKRGKIHVSEEIIDNVIPFDMPGALKTRDKFEILLYYYSNMLTHQVKDKKTGKIRTVTYGADGFKQMIKENKLDEPADALDENGDVKLDKNGNPKKIQYYDITAGKIEKAYISHMKNIRLTYQDKLNILAQRIFEEVYGYGPVDTLLDTSIDEVQGGVSGIPAGKYDIKETDLQNVTYSYEAIWIVASGKKIRVSALSFGTNDELVRITQNIYKYDPSHVLSKTEGRVVATMKNGARVIAFRDPFALTHGFIVRKFDSAPSVAPEKLLMDRARMKPERGALIAILASKWLVKGMFNIAITGEQGTGKTTWLKSLIRFIRPDLSIRTQELTRELNLNFTYPDRNIISFVETESVSSQDGLDFQKKTSGDINIIGEVANAISASWIIQTAKVASRMTMFTHHAKTAYDLVVAIRNNVMDCGNYTNERSVDQMVAECININEHFENDAGHRYMERITYIFPVFGEPYPVEDPSEVQGDEFDRAMALNENEFRKRLTDRKTFDFVNLVEFDKRHERYKFVGFPDAVLAGIKKNVTDAEYEEFLTEYEEIKGLESKLAAEDAEMVEEKGA